MIKIAENIGMSISKDEAAKILDEMFDEMYRNYVTLNFEDIPPLWEVPFENEEAKKLTITVAKDVYSTLLQNVDTMRKQTISDVEQIKKNEERETEAVMYRGLGETEAQFPSWVTDDVKDRVRKSSDHAGELVRIKEELISGKIGGIMDSLQNEEDMKKITSDIKNLITESINYRDWNFVTMTLNNLETLQKKAESEISALSHTSENYKQQMILIDRLISTCEDITLHVKKSLQGGR